MFEHDQNIRVPPRFVRKDLPVVTEKKTTLSVMSSNILSDLFIYSGIKTSAVEIYVNRVPPRFVRKVSIRQ